MEGYNHMYPPQDMGCVPMAHPGPAAPIGHLDHGDGWEYYGLDQLYGEDQIDDRTTTDRDRRSTKRRDDRGHRSRSTSAGDTIKTRTISGSRSRTRSRSRSRTRSRSKSRSPNRSATRSPCESRPVRELNAREPSILDTFRVLYLTSNKYKKNTAKYLATKKKQDRIQEFLKSDGLGSKRWLFYPRPQKLREEPLTKVAVVPRENCDQRVKIDGAFFRKYKKHMPVDSDAPIAKLKRWELNLYNKFGFIHVV